MVKWYYKSGAQLGCDHCGVMIWTAGRTRALRLLPETKNFLLFVLGKAFVHARNNFISRKLIYVHIYIYIYMCIYFRARSQLHYLGKSLFFFLGAKRPLTVTLITLLRPFVRTVSDKKVSSLSTYRSSEHFFGMISYVLFSTISDLRRSRWNSCQ